MPDKPFRLPTENDRVSIVGATGSGKTQFAVWLLSLYPYDEMPFVVYNWKNDSLIDGIPYSKRLAVNDVPLKPGIWIVNPLPHQQDEVEAQMWEIWRRGNIGVYIDEGYMVGNSNPAFRALLTQGRSKRIPMIILSQRPVRMDTFVFSESQFFVVFRLQHNRDSKNVREFVPIRRDTKPLPKYHSYYYHVEDTEPIVLRPVPEVSTIYSVFEKRLRPLRAVI